MAKVLLENLLDVACTFLRQLTIIRKSVLKGVSLSLSLSLDNSGLYCFTTWKYSFYKNGKTEMGYREQQSMLLY
jgi:hypothetical protein